MSGWQQQLEQALQQRRDEGLYREHTVVQSAQGPQVRNSSGQFHNFSSNDYLGLAAHPELRDAFVRGLGQYGVGSASSHLVCGHSQAHHDLEQALATFLQRDRVLLFSSGYMANFGVLTALLDRGDAIFEDRLNHASLLDGGLASGARFQRFRHNDVEHLQSLLEKSVQASGEYRRRLIAVDGVFSMDGDLAPLPELAMLAKRHDAMLMVDDAHGLGVLGARGAGTLEHFGLGQNDVPLLIGTLGKAFGVAGAFVAGSETMIETLVQFARPYIYTTALPPAQAVAAQAGLEIVASQPERRTQLAQHVAYFSEQVHTRQWTQRFGVELLSSVTAVQPLVVGSAARAVNLQQALLQQGIMAIAIRSPTVPQGTARLRIGFSAAHTHDQVGALVEALETVLAQESPSVSGASR